MVSRIYEESLLNSTNKTIKDSSPKFKTKIKTKTMFKKLFNNLVGNNEEKEQAQAENETTVEMEATENTVEEEQDESVSHQVDNVQFDPETLHGTHYTIEAFKAEVEKRAEKWIAGERAEDPNFSQADVDNVYFNYKRKVYAEWNNMAEHDNRLLQWEMADRNLKAGLSAYGETALDSNDPLLEPIHGVTLQDYTAMNIKFGQGIDADLVCKAMGIELTVWQEASTLWAKRMEQDTTFKVATLFGQYYKDGDNHPKLMHLKPVVSEVGGANLEKLKTDRHFYEELCGAREAAYEAGLDGAQWIADNYGMGLVEFQAIATEWMTADNKDVNMDRNLKLFDYKETKKKEYAAKFAAEQGGNVADDVEF